MRDNTYLRMRRSEMDRGNLSWPNSADGIVWYIKNKPIRKTKKTAKTTVNSYLVRGNLLSELKPNGFLLLVGESSPISTSLINFSCSTLIKNKNTDNSRFEDYNKIMNDNGKKAKPSIFFFFFFIIR